MSDIFTPFTQKNVSLRNRIVMSPMCMYTAEDDGKATDWHYVHYGTRAVGGVGLVMQEATAVEARGRISHQDLGIWSDKHIEPLRRIVSFVKAQGAAAAIQLAHAGRKARLNDTTIVAPSAIPFDEESQVPHELTEAEIDDVVEAWRQGARRAREAGFDIVEIHGAHGYLINEFLSPLSNKRTDKYGGDIKSRCLFLTRVIEAVKQEWPEENPLYLRLSAVDHAEGGLTIEDSVEIAKIAKEVGVDLIDCSSGAILPVAPKKIFPGYQVSYAETIRREAGIATGSVGLIEEHTLANEIIGNERADLIFLGRVLLRNPYWVLQASKERHREYAGPRQYERGFK
ncbi:NADPH dehydrogenase [Aneurinibacillus migulanus]|uniref:NADPH dehydrogenase NamA n=1 Tax=Aneurinibacillus migulanus TaxID=47500 RepID=UPI0005BDBF74|nr:NADPH dehydrogenase NamA [Aneurinibacillus migulanus]KIV54238.1 NADPH dehydrogenase [Aneurinibacillus migulanus]KPD05800.1 NADPH dehydrogenase [Aneurinibacillus migulanus]